VVVVYRDYDFCGVLQPLIRSVSQADKASEAFQHHTQLGVFREIRKVRDFRLVLCADVWNDVGEYPVRVLEGAVAVEKAEGGFNEEFPEPLVIYRPRMYQTNLSQDLYASTPTLPWPPIRKHGRNLVSRLFCLPPAFY